MWQPHTVTLVEADTTVDMYGATRLAYSGTGTRVSAFVQPKENTDGAVETRTTTRLSVWTRVEVPLTARVTVAGAVYEVEDTRRWDDARGNLHHYETTLRRVEG